MGVRRNAGLGWWWTEKGLVLKSLKFQTLLQNRLFEWCPLGMFFGSIGKLH